MTASKRQAITLFVTLALSAGGAGWCGAHLARRRAVAAAAVADAAACRDLVAKIESLRLAPAKAGAADLQMDELAQRIEAAAGASGVAAASIVRIWPEPARHVGESAYLEKPTQVLLRNVTLRQLITFTHNLTADLAALRLQRLRLTAPRQDPAGRTWTADVTLSYLIYAPPTDAPQRTAWNTP